MAAPKIDTTEFTHSDAAELLSLVIADATTEQGGRAYLISLKNLERLEGLHRWLEARAAA